MGNIYHEWNGTILTITSDSGTSSCDLKGSTGDIGPRGAQGPAGTGSGGGGTSTDLSNYYTKTETDAAISAAVDDVEESATTALNTANSANTAATNASVKATNAQTAADAAQARADEAYTLAQAATGGTVDLSNYYTKTETDTAINNATGDAIARADAAQDRADEAYELAQAATGGTVDLSNYYTKSEVYTKTETDAAISAAVGNNSNGGGTTVTVGGVAQTDWDADTKLDKVTTTGTYSRLYGITSAGKQTTFVISREDTPIAGAIPKYSSTKHLVINGTPTASNHAASKQYVDDAISNLDSRITTLENGGGGIDGSAYHYYFDDADYNWIAAEYDETFDSTGYCPNCGCKLSEINMASFDTTCPYCNIAITYNDGDVTLMGGGSSDGGGGSNLIKVTGTDYGLITLGASTIENDSLYMITGTARHDIGDNQFTIPPTVIDTTLGFYQQRITPTFGDINNTDADRFLLSYDRTDGLRIEFIYGSAISTIHIITLFYQKLM